MRIGGCLVRALAQELLGEAGLVVIVSGLPDLHLEFDLVLRRIVLRCLPLRVALHPRGPRLTVSNIVVSTIDHFLRVW